MNRALLPLLTLLLPAVALTGEDSRSRTFAAGNPGSATTQSIVELIKKMEIERVQAGVRKDVEAIAAVTADDYLQVDWNGQVLNKMDTLERSRVSPRTGWPVRTSYRA
jgi:hypothetical protein